MQETEGKSYFKQTLRIQILFFVLYLLTGTLAILLFTKPGQDFLAKTGSGVPKIFANTPSEPLVKVVPTPQFPEEYHVIMPGRKQKYNLSCEFAAAVAIIHYFTKDPFFVFENEEMAEKMLIAMVPLSDNPNTGIRMGVRASDSANKLFTLIEKPIGSLENYGVHAPPFIPVFEKYGLEAKPIAGLTDYIATLKKELSSGKLIMMWTFYEQFGDMVLTPVSEVEDVMLVRGEHAEVIQGYDRDGFYAMDPSSGRVRYYSNNHINFFASKFEIPYLSVSKR